jgi:anti-sigma factor ChrR (cupin superfamily)
MSSDQTSLGETDTRYIDVENMEWEESGLPGILKKTLYSDEARGVSTVLFKMSPGSKVPLHEHTDIEQTFMLEGSLRDSQGEITPGNYAWRPAGSVHVAHAPDGAVFLSVFLNPNRFFGPDDEIPSDAY